MRGNGYLAAIREGARHHADSKTYSGSLLRPHKPFLTDMIQRLGCRSVLDYGCGKGVQYEWVDPADGMTLERAWGLEVTKYDPCWPPFAAEPEGRFDVVICTHTLSLIPRDDLGWVSDRLFHLADRGLFVAEKIGARKKSEVADPHARAINWSADQWVDWFTPLAERYPEIELALSLRTTEGGAKITRRHMFRDGEPAEVLEAGVSAEER